MAFLFSFFVFSGGVYQSEAKCIIHHTLPNIPHADSGFYIQKGVFGMGFLEVSSVITVL